MRRVEMELKIEITKDRISCYVTVIDGEKTKPRDLGIT